jgi:hypothetical protein
MFWNLFTIKFRKRIAQPARCVPVPALQVVRPIGVDSFKFPIDKCALYRLVTRKMAVQLTFFSVWNRIWWSWLARSGLVFWDSEFSLSVWSGVRVSQDWSFLSWYCKNNSSQQDTWSRNRVRQLFWARTVGAISRCNRSDWEPCF